VLRLRPARPEDTGALTALARRSKAHWGYSADFLAACRDELTVPAEACAAVVVAETGDAAGTDRAGGPGDPDRPEAGPVTGPVGFAWLGDRDGAGRIELVALFVEPRAIGTGVGRLLFDDARARARACGARTLWWDADPHAEEIYRHLGGTTVTQVPSGSVPGRSLPRMELAL
jgi:GNAT superfamily N-acetyltransferase